MTPEDRRESSRKGTLICLIMIQALWALSLVPWSVGAMFTLISIGQVGWIPPWIIAVWCYPVLLIGFSSAAWRLFLTERYAAAAIVSLLPPVPVMVVFAFTWVAEVAAAV